MIELLPLPPATTAAVRMVCFADSVAARAAYDGWLGSAGVRLDRHVVSVTGAAGQHAAVAAELRRLPAVVPTVFVAAGAALPLALGLCADGDVAPDHLVVVGTATPPPAGVTLSDLPVTVLAGARDVDPASPRLSVWRAAAPDTVTLRLLAEREADLLTPGATVAALLTALFRIDEAFPELPWSAGSPPTP